MLLYTAHGKDARVGRSSVADRTGLTEYLGYKPMFCSLVNPDSLADTWFRVWSASPSYVDVIDVYELDDSEVTPMDVVDWCDTCFGLDGEPYPNDNALFEAMLNAEHPESTDYIIKPGLDVRRSWRFDVKGFINYEVDDFGLDEDKRKALVASLERMRLLPRNPALSMYNTVGGSIAEPTMEQWYRFMTVTGVVPVVWSVVTGNDISPDLVRIDPIDLMQTAGFQRAQSLLMEWDNSLGETIGFGHARYSSMRNAFITGLDQLAHGIAEQKAGEGGTSRNGTCFCGSGRKYKKCCMRKGMDQLARDWQRA